MTNHKKYLDCDHPDLARSAQSWLDDNDFEDVNLDHLSEPEEKREFPGLSQGWSCNRKRVYQALDYPRSDFRWSAKTKFDSGNFFEAYWMSAVTSVWDIQDHILSDGGQRDVSIEIEGTEVQGHPDGILEHNGKEYIIECKSMSQAQFDARWNDTSVEKMVGPEGILQFDWQDDEHWNWWGNYVAQTLGYCAATEIPNILYLFVGRDHGVMCAYQSFEPRAWSKVKSRWGEVLRAIDAGELPSRPVSVQELRRSNKNVWKGSDSYPCAYCAWFRECHSDIDPTKEVDDVSGKSHLVVDNGGRA
jgi:hypothetical protein